jgi:hypothetical protein
MHAHELTVRRLRLRLATLLALRKAVAYLALWCFLWGSAVIVLRVTAATPPLLLFWGLAVVPLLTAAALIFALRQLPEPALLRAVLDRAGGYGGLLMAAGERPLGAWDRTLPPAAEVRLRWHGGRACMVLGVSVVFVLVALLLPQQAVDLASNQALEVGKEVEKLAAQLDLLKEEAVLEPARADSLKEKLARIKDDAEGANPVKTLEALDHLQNLVNKESQKAAEDSISAAEKMAQSEALAEALNKLGDALDAKVRAEAMADLAGLAQQAADESRLADLKLDLTTLKALKAGRLSAEQLKKLAEALKGGQKGLKERLGKLCEAKLIDPELLKECEGACQCDGECLAELLKRYGDKCKACDLCKQCNLLGRGGVTEGPGAAKLTFGEKSSEDGAKFKEEALPPGALAGLKNSQVVGVGRDTPSVTKEGPARSGALNQAVAGGGSAQSQVVLPRHRGAVERYFERPTAKSGPGKGE